MVQTGGPPGRQVILDYFTSRAHALCKFVEAQKVRPKGKTGRAYIALNLIIKLYGIESDLKASSDAERKIGRHEHSL